jgi:hypothetical protein
MGNLGNLTHIYILLATYDHRSKHIENGFIDRKVIPKNHLPFRTLFKYSSDRNYREVEPLPKR